MIKKILIGIAFILALSPFAVGRAEAAITAGNSTSGGSFNGGTSNTFSHTRGANSNYLIVMVGSVGSVENPITAVTYNGVSMTKLHYNTFTTQNYPSFSIWGLASPSSGSNTVSVSHNSNSQGYMYAIDYQNVAQTSTTGGTSAGATSNVINTTGNSANLTTQSANSLIIGGIASDNGTSSGFDNVSGQTSLKEENGGTNGTKYYFGYRMATTTQAYNTGYTWSSSLNGTSMAFIEIKEFVASGPANVKTYNGLASASTKVKNGLSLASIKSADGLQ